MMMINYMGTVHCVKAALPDMLAPPARSPATSAAQSRGGRIVFVSSQVGQLGMFGYSAYSPTKFAVRGLAECLYPELKPHNIHLSISYPPDTDTAMVKPETTYVDCCHSTATDVFYVCFLFLFFGCSTKKR